MSFFSLCDREKKQERTRCTLRCRQNVVPSHCAAGLATLKQVLALPAAPCSITSFYTCISRYRNHVRSKVLGQNPPPYWKGYGLANVVRE